MNKVTITNLIVIILLLLVFGLLIHVALQVKTEGFLCINDPLGYGASKLSEANNAELSCTCSLAKPNSPILFFDSKNKTLMFPEVQQSTTEKFDFNFSNIVRRN